MIFLTRDTAVRLVSKGTLRSESHVNIRGSWVWPVTSFRGGIAVVLYGILMELFRECGQCDLYNSKRNVVCVKVYR